MNDANNQAGRVAAQSHNILVPVQREIAYSICTNVTDMAEYAMMIASFRSQGFGDDCEFLHVDNTRDNACDAFEAYNLYLDRARGPHVVLCHQDIVLDHDGRDRLDSIIAELHRFDPNWVAFGNAGADAKGDLALHISDPHGPDRWLGTLPTKAMSLDENFIVVRRASNVGFSRNIGGFHLYGADLCMIADVLGGQCYVMDFHLTHKSPGRKRNDFYESRSRMIDKYRHAFRHRWLVTPSTIMPIGGGLRLPALLTSEKFVALLGRLRLAPFPRRKVR